MRGYAAALMMFGAASHLVLAILHFGASPVVAMLLGAMSAWCLHCALHLWKSGSARSWATAAVGGFGMIVLHVGLMTVPRPTGSSGNHHAAGPSHLDGLMTMSMAVGIVAEVVVIVGAIVVSPFGVYGLQKDSRG
ncbi:hypothetical protein [Antrihabitans stalactiti]|uniref:Uncharacterized protein n=1 Tax=Antrihabitans stalactiti TaxID=2584121 RepID=A0A848KFS4_9NOCA|nr:hypothetical protein [Antrihabitans stalactiti]NMN95552.1 hypothetical protein [Antrihabitans stalactiti]